MTIYGFSTRINAHGRPSPTLQAAHNMVVRALAHVEREASQLRAEIDNISMVDPCAGEVSCGCALHATFGEPGHGRTGTDH